MSGGPFSFVIAADAIPGDGRRFHLEADEHALHRLAEALGIAEVLKLSADIEARALRGGDIAVRGRLTATVVQTDVVTLEPLQQEIAEEIDVTLRPAERPIRKASHAGEFEEAERDEADVFDSGRIDIGALVVEHLALGLDPYPRTPGVHFEPHLEDASPPEGSPFAVLEKLKRGDR